MLLIGAAGADARTRRRLPGTRRKPCELAALRRTDDGVAALRRTDDGGNVAFPDRCDSSCKKLRQLAADLSCSDSVVLSRSSSRIDLSRSPSRIESSILWLPCMTGAWTGKRDIEVESSSTLPIKRRSVARLHPEGRLTYMASLVRSKKRRRNPRGGSGPPSDCLVEDRSRELPTKRVLFVPSRLSEPFRNE